MKKYFILILAYLSTNCTKESVPIKHDKVTGASEILETVFSTPLFFNDSTCLLIPVVKGQRNKMSSDIISAVSSYSYSSANYLNFIAIHKDDDNVEKQTRQIFSESYSIIWKEPLKFEGESLLAFLATTVDTNNDKLLDNNDQAQVFITDECGAGLTSISPADAHVTSFQFEVVSKKIILNYQRVVEDKVKQFIGLYNVQTKKYVEKELYLK